MGRGPSRSSLRLILRHTPKITVTVKLLTSPFDLSLVDPAGRLTADQSSIADQLNGCLHFRLRRVQEVCLFFCQLPVGRQPAS